MHIQYVEVFGSITSEEAVLKNSLFGDSIGIETLASVSMEGLLATDAVF